MVRNAKDTALYAVTPTPAKAMPEPAVAPEPPTPAPEPDPGPADAPADAAAEPKPVAPSRASGLRRVILLLVGAAIAAALVWKGHDWWTVGRFVLSTDDAYARADIATLSAQVPGTVSAILVADNVPVKAGDLLLTLDDAAYRARLAQGQANVAAARAALANIGEREKLQRSEVSSAEATLVQAQAKLAYAQTNVARSNALLARGATTQADTDSENLNLDAAKASVKQAQAALEVERGQFPVLEGERAQEAAAIAAAEATVTLAEQDLSYTAIRASRDGIVANRGVEIGEYVRAGSRLLSVVPLNDVYVVANFKETQVRDFREGMVAEVDADVLGGTTFKGTIESLAPASGAEFALLPPENATGNFTKIVQRIPVRIRIDQTSGDVAAPLRPGTSVSVRVNVKDARK